MTLLETVEMLNVFSDYFPEMVIKESTATNWQKMLTRVKKKDMDKYIRTYVSSSKWPPHISDLKTMWQMDAGAEPCDDTEGK